MDARFTVFNEALMALEQGLREGAMNVAEFRLRRRQLLIALITPPTSASGAGSDFELLSEAPSNLPEAGKTWLRRGMMAAAFLLLAVLLYGALA